MTDAVQKISMDALKSNNQIMACVAVIWLVIMACAVTSVLSHSFSRKQRTFWIVLIVGFPLLGLLSYLPFAFSKENYPGLFNGKRDK
jgi:hypothetical protein